MAEPRLRLFFALSPGEPTREKLLGLTAAARARSGGRPVVHDNLHLTLAFLGSVAQSKLTSIEGIALESAPFALTLDRVGYWPRTKICWLGMAATPAPLQRLFEDLWCALENLGFERDKHPFRPHITLARKAGPPGPLLLDEPLTWPVNDVALMQSEGASRGVVYKTLKRWPLVANTW